MLIALKKHPGATFGVFAAVATVGVSSRDGDEIEQTHPSDTLQYDPPTRLIRYSTIFIRRIRLTNVDEIYQTNPDDSV